MRRQSIYVEGKATGNVTDDFGATITAIDTFLPLSVGYASPFVSWPLNASVRIIPRSSKRRLKPHSG